MCVKTARREQEIIALLESRGDISVAELSGLLGISESTLRKQLSVMQRNGMVIRTYGGVMSVNRVPDESFESKLHKNMAEKRKIAEKARELIPAGASVALGSGTTVYGLGMLLDDHPKGVIYSNSLQTADYLSRVAGLEVHICGGIVRGRTSTVIGNEVAEYFRGLKQLDYAFIGCDAINMAGEVMSDSLSVASAEKILFLSAKHRYVLCDSSKIGQSAVARITGLKNCDGLVIDYCDSRIIERYQTLTKLIYA